MKRRTLLATGAAAAAAAAFGVPARAQDKTKVGFIYVGPINDGGWTQHHHHSAKEMVAHFGDKVDFVYQESVPEGPDAERAITQMALGGADIIFTTSFGYMDPTINVAAKFPDVKFEHATGYKTADNVSVYSARFYEGRAIQGTLAGHMTKTNKIGMVGGHAIGEVVGEGVRLTGVLIPPDSRLAGRSAQAIGLSWRKRTVLMGIARRGKHVRKRLRQAVIEPGDILLLLTPTDTTEDVIDWIGGLALADRGLAVTQDSKTWLAIGFFGAAVLAASVGLLYLPIALGLVVIGYVLARILPLTEVYTHIEWPVVVLLGSMIPLGAALETSGGTELIAGALVGLTQGLPAWAVLTVLMVVTMTLSDVLNNTATTIVAAPVGIQMAAALDKNPDPFLMAVAVAASAAFLTPIGHKNNTLVLGPGGYSFGDYWRMGLPLEVIVVAVSVPAILVFWPL